MTGVRIARFCQDVQDVGRRRIFEIENVMLRNIPHVVNLLISLALSLVTTATF
jgi:hypothetical protein